MANAHSKIREYETHRQIMDSIRTEQNSKELQNTQDEKIIELKAKVDSMNIL